MIDIHQATLKSVVFHFIPDSESGQDMQTGVELLEMDEEINAKLLHFLTQNFKEPEFHAFTFANDDFVLNPLYNYVGNIFDEIDFYEQSIKIARHLFNKSRHPFIKSGELLVAFLENVLIDDEMTSGVCLFKLETTKDLLGVERSSRTVNLQKLEGFDLEKLDKACIIFDIDRDAGFKMLNVDHSNRNIEARYWRDEFLQIKEVTNDYLATKEYIRLTARFVKSNESESVFDGKAEKAAVMHKSEKYFSNNENFDEAVYLDQVFETQMQKENFKNFKSLEEENGDKVFKTEFDISEQATKKSSRVFKSIIKLDKNFHIYVHGDHTKIRKGIDGDGNKYYQIFYDEET